MRLENGIKEMASSLVVSATGQALKHDETQNRVSQVEVEGKHG